MSRPPKSKALERLKKVRDAIPDLKKLQDGSSEFMKWHRNTKVAIANTFDDTSQHVKDFTKIRYSLMMMTADTPDSAFQRAYVSGLESASSVLQSMIEEVEEYWENDGMKIGTTPSQPPIKKTGDVFIIHGRDDGKKDTVARFITTLGLNPIILHEQSNQGRTIIEKFEQHAEKVGYAIALLTADDVGSLKGQEKDLKPRARQNVIFEFGYFMGRLGRDHVCALTEDIVDIPSDYAGVVYIPLDVSGAWKMSLVRELKAAGFAVDANLVL